MRQYNDLEYANNRLAGTIVSHNGDPVYVHHLDVDEQFLVEYLGTRDKGHVKAKDLDINPVPLGYVNTNYGAVYIGRKPIRKDWRQGYRYANSFSFGMPMKDLDLQYLHNTIKGVYPPIGGCIKKARNKQEHVAFHREWCVTEEDTLLYKDDKVGVWRDERFILDEKYTYLEGKLTEALNENYRRNS